MGATNSSSAPVGNSCNDCDLKFSHFARRNRRICLECRNIVCVSCIGKVVSSHSSHTAANGQQLSDRSRKIIPGYCKNCCTLVCADPTHQQLSELKIKHLKAFLIRREIAEVDSCVEKKDLVDLILAHYGGKTHMAWMEQERQRQEQLMSRLSQPTETPEETPDTKQTQPQVPVEVEVEASQSQPAETLDIEQAQPEVQVEVEEEVKSSQRVHPLRVSADAPVVTDSNVNDPVLSSGDNNSEASILSPSSTDSHNKQSSASMSKFSLNEVDSESDVDTLTVKQLKVILVRNLVDYKGCKEKYELIEKVKMLWQSRQANQRLYEQLLNPQVPADGVPANREETELCKICMDSTIDCVLLNCGHMVTCTQCGKQMNECPICRQFVVKAVHIFRA